MNLLIKKIGAFLLLFIGSTVFSINAESEGLETQMQFDQFQKIMMFSGDVFEHGINYCMENEFNYFKIAEFSLENEKEVLSYKAKQNEEGDKILENKDDQKSYKIICYKNQPADDSIISVKKYNAIMKAFKESKDMQEKEPSKNVLHISSIEEFNKEIASSQTPIFVDFYSDSCPPCKKLAPIFDQWADNLVSKIKFLKVNIKNLSELGDKYDIKAIPTLFIFNKDGILVGKKIGFPNIVIFFESLKDKEKINF